MRLSFFMAETTTTRTRTTEAAAATTTIPVYKYINITFDY